MNTETTIIVMAKECLPGKVKTRLHPPFTLEEAAGIAQASLADTFEAAGATGLPVVVCAQGEVSVPTGFRVIPQVSGGLDERIGAVLDSVPGRVLLIGMDTPQVDPTLLRALADDWPADVDAWIGPATDGGFWLLGIEDLRPGRLGSWSRGDLVRGVPMSVSDTGAHQRRRLVRMWLRVRDAPPLTDIDDLASLRDVAAVLPPRGHLADLLPRFADVLETTVAVGSPGEGNGRG